MKLKSYAFAIDIVKLAKEIRLKGKEFVLSKQLLRSGTAIGALVREAEFGQSRADFSSKLSIALKEANETEYWLSILHDTEMIDNNTFEKSRNQCKELIAMLVNSVRTTQIKPAKN